MPWVYTWDDRATEPITITAARVNGGPGEAITFPGLRGKTASKPQLPSWERRTR